MRKFYNFTGSKLDLRIKWITRKTKTLYKLKNKCLHPACKIYHGVCNCGETYVGETVEMYKPDGTNTTCHQKKQTPPSIWVAT